MAKFCKSCGAPLGDGAKFCGTCGTKVDQLSDKEAAGGTETVPEIAASEGVPFPAFVEESDAAVSVNDVKTAEAAAEAIEETQPIPEQAEHVKEPEKPAVVAAEKSAAAQAVKTGRPQPSKRKSVWDDLEKKNSPDEPKVTEDLSAKKPQPAHYKGVWDDIGKQNNKEEKKKSNSQLIPIIASVLVVIAIGIAVLFKMGVFSKGGGSTEPGTPPVAVQTDEPTADPEQTQSSGDTQDTGSGTDPETAADEQNQDKVVVSLVMETEADSDERNLVLKAEKHETGDEPIGYVDVKTARIRVRKGPSTSSTDTKKRTAVGDKYDVYEKTTGEGYNWYRISNNNEWIADNNGKWMKFTAYEYKAPDQVKPEAVAESYYSIYKSYIDSINHGGDFSYLKNTDEGQLETFRNNYSRYSQGYSFEIKEFNVDLTDIQIVETKNGYDALVHAYTVNTSTDLNAGNTQENEVKLLARLSYKDDSGKWTLVWQRSDSQYNPDSHETYSCL